MKRLTLALLVFFVGCGQGDTMVNFTDSRECVVSDGFNVTCDDLATEIGEGGGEVQCRPNENNAGDQGVQLCSTTVTLDNQSGKEGLLGTIIATASERFAACKLPDGNYVPATSDHCELPAS